VQTAPQVSRVYDSAEHPSAMLNEIVELIRYRHLVAQFVRRDVISRYKRSVLGVAWTMLNPLGMMLVMSLVFSQVFHTTPAYPAYLLSGLIAWNFFAQTSSAASVHLISGGTLIQRIYIPKTLFAVSATGTGLVNLLLALIPLVGVLLLSGIPLRAPILLLPIAILLLVAFTLGMGLILSTLTVYFPDVADIYQIALMAWMYLTPIIYPESVIPESLQRWLFTWNPLYYLIKFFRAVLYDGIVPDAQTILLSLGAAFGTLVLGWFIFTRKSDEFAYRI
jgi:ABC-type polysaccharide/polyol phosphate export permease